jgi:ferredoxin-type protein NapH
MASRFRSPIVSARYVVNTFIILALFAIPSFRVIKFDLVGGTFYLFGNEESWLTVLTVFIGLWAGTYVVILLTDYFFGRLFCGWLCSWGTLLRTLRYLDDKVKRKKYPRVFVPLATILASVIASLGLMNWFFEPGDLTQPYVLATFGLFTAVGFVMLYKVGLRFCQQYCPIGWYLGTLSQRNLLHIDFQAATCTVGDVCVRECPMALDPRLLVTNAEHATYSQCILCADCLTACNKCAAKVEGPKPLTLQLSEPPTDSTSIATALEQRRTAVRTKRTQRSATRAQQAPVEVSIEKHSLQIEE